MGKWRCPRPINHHVSSRLQAVRARGAPHLPFGFAWNPSPSAPWARGLLSAFLESGYLDLPACGPLCGSIDGLVRPIFCINKSRPSRGAKPHEADDTMTSGKGRLPRRPPEEEIFLCKHPPQEDDMTPAMMTKARRAPVGAEQ